MTPFGNLLLVEDCPDMAEIIRYRLEESGFGLRVAQTLAAARTEMNRRRPDAVILDLLLPDGNGRSLLKEMRSDFDLRRVPVVILTGMNDRSNVEAGFDAGANAYLDKSFALERLPEVLRCLEREASSSPVP